MVSKIRVLDEHTINKIAAGEVIENPSSVVKELVENAIDAGASEITVEIKSGGRQLIRVTDNGCGMSMDDALLSFERHATSKIRNIEEIHTIETMGFRGEAIPSIASISKLTLLTRMEEEKEGTLIMIEAGKILSCSSAVRSPGTTFEVKSLFFNVPVRKKFQRSPAYDTTEIQKIVTLQALANPSVKFQLISNEKILLTTPIPQNQIHLKCIGERISDVLGSDYFASLCPLEKEFGEYKLMGYIGLPHYSRHNRTGQYLFINKRAVTSSLISYALRNAYGTTLGTSRHPIFVLYLTMDGSLVDVNVHPQKREVRLRQEYHLKELLTKAVEEALQQSGNLSFQDPHPFEEWHPSSFKSHFIQPNAFSTPEEFEWKAPVFTSKMETEPLAPSFFEQQENEQKHSTAPPSTVIATLPGYSVLSSSNGSLQLLDQRAAHSRILYEQLLNFEDKSRFIAAQNLLIPYMLDLPSDEAAVLKNHLEEINRLGFQIQEFGGNSFIIQSIPKIFNENAIRDVILEIIQTLKNFQLEHVVEKEIQKRLSQSAARAALSKNCKTTTLEAQSLYNQLMKCKSPYICPSGKPTIIELATEEIAKQFQK